MRVAFASLPFLAAALIGAGCSRRAADDIVLGTLERDRFELTAEASEPLVEIAVREGDAVATGQTLVRLATTTIDAQRDAARAAASQARNRLAELVAGPRVEAVLAARARLEGAESAVLSETNEFNRVRKLVDQRLLSGSKLDRQRAARDTAAAARKQARAELTELIRGTRIEALDQARDALSAAESRLRELDISAGRHVVTAPVAGIIEALPYRLGERPPVGSPVAILLRAGAPYARVYVPEPLRARIATGTAAEVSIDGVATPLAGKVRYVASEAAFTPYYALTQRDRRHLAFLAEITLDSPDALTLPAGLPAQARFLLVP